MCECGYKYTYIHTYVYVHNHTPFAYACAHTNMYMHIPAHVYLDMVSWLIPWWSISGVNTAHLAISAIIKAQEEQEKFCHIYLHTYIQHKYILAYMHADVFTCIRTFVHMYITYIAPGAHAPTEPWADHNVGLHIYIYTHHKSIHTCIHTHIQAHEHTYMGTYIGERSFVYILYVHSCFDPSCFFALTHIQIHMCMHFMHI